MSARWKARSGTSWLSSQKEQILRTQIRVLQNELGEDEDETRSKNTVRRSRT